MNILIITQSLTGGGAEKLAANLSLELAKENRVVLVTYRKDEIEYDHSGIRICIDKFGGMGGLLQHVKTACERIRIIKRIKKKYDIDYSVSFIPQTDYANVFSRVKKEKIILDVVSNMSFVYPSGIRHAFRKRVIKKADFVVTVSEGVRQDLIYNFGVKKSKSRVIYNSIDLSAIIEDCKQDTEFKRIKDMLPQKYICSMGSFRQAKGHWHLIKAFASVKDSIPDIDLVILGDGPYRKKYEELAGALGVKDRVYLPGFANPPYSVISHSKLFVFSSIFEGFGHSVIEAMACGVPVLSTDCNYGPREIIFPMSDITKKANSVEIGEYGFLVPPFGDDDIDCMNSISELEKLMGETIADILNGRISYDRVVEKGMKYVERFDNLEYARQWIEVMRSI